MSVGPEQVFSVTPAIDALVGLDYEFLPQEAAEAARDGLNQVLLRDAFIESVQRLNDVLPRGDAGEGDSGADQLPIGVGHTHVKNHFLGLSGLDLRDRRQGETRYSKTRQPFADYIRSLNHSLPFPVGFRRHMCFFLKRKTEFRRAQRPDHGLQQSDSTPEKTLPPQQRVVAGRPVLNGRRDPGARS